MSTKKAQSFNKSVVFSMLAGLRVVNEFPRSKNALIKILAHQPKAQIIRKKYADRGVAVPPLLIISTTNKCNLRCKGCYASHDCSSAKGEMKLPEIRKLFAEAVSAGCSAVLLAGGEPMLKQDWLQALSDFPDLLGLVFTNGTLLDEITVNWFSQHRNIVPMISIEGTSLETDSRRGEGVSAKINRAMHMLRDAKVPFGVSITTGGHNFGIVTGDEFIDKYINLGCRLVIHVEYVPAKKSDELFVLSETEKAELQKYCKKRTGERQSLFIAFPGDEDIFDGCLAAGRGFVYINSNGSLEPCPFAPFSDRNIKDVPLIEALQSPLFKKIRDNSEKLHEGEGGCALLSKSDWLEEQLAK